MVGEGAGGDEREMPRKFLEVTCEGWHSSKVERRESIPAGEPTWAEFCPQLPGTEWGGLSDESMGWSLWSSGGKAGWQSGPDDSQQPWPTQMPSVWATGGKKNPLLKKKIHYFSKCPVFLNNTKGKQMGSPQTILCTQACGNPKGIWLSQQVWLMFSSRLCVRPKEEGVQGKAKSRG